MSDKYINFDIEDPRASSIAEAMANKTCKKILSMLAEKEMSASEIASSLNIPLNTAGYNIDKLMKAGLIEEVKGFFWSVKGKRIPVYRISNKKILISPKRMAAPIAMIAAIIGAIVLIALIAQVMQTSEKNIIYDNQLRQFSSFDELKEFLKTHTESGSYGYYGFSSGDSGPAVAASSSKEIAGSYSQTNIQVTGVDEPDIVKNDGKYIYVVSGSKVAIVNAYPAEEMKIVSEIETNRTIINIFVNEDKLVVFSISNERVVADTIIEKVVSGVASMIAPIYSKTKVNVGIYDISDREKPSIERNASIIGGYVSARMIDNYVYLISSEYINANSPDLPVYSVDGIEKKVTAEEIYYPDYNDNRFVFTSILAINLNNDEVSEKTYLTGGSGIVYVSENNIYLTNIKRVPYLEYQKKLMTEAILPLLSGNTKEKVENILSSEKFRYNEYSEAMKIVYEYSNSLRGEEKANFDSLLQKATNDFSVRIAKESERTIIHKINIDKNEINYAGNGEVIGHLLNQFSMDEYKGNFRIATTTGETWSGNSLNHLFVLDENLNLAGSVEDLAEGEKIYSVRFMNNRAYVVTFKKIDPFYVIDLTDKPKVLGYLKIPGYSDYLHPYDENHIIGIGKNARGGGENFAWYQGVKISLFDVSDIEAPKEKAHFDIGDRGTDSIALQEHKAFLFDKEKNLLVLPIRLAEIDRSKYRDNESIPDNAYGEMKWSGAYVLNINENEISLRGKVSHFPDTKPIYGPAKNEPIGATRVDSEGNVWTKTNVGDGYGDNIWRTDADKYANMDYYDYNIDTFPGGISEINFYDYKYQIQRSLYMDDVLYTLSPSLIKANDLRTIDELSQVKLPIAEIYGYVEY